MIEPRYGPVGLSALERPRANDRLSARRSSMSLFWRELNRSAQTIHEAPGKPMTRLAGGGKIEFRF